jgi:Methyltransferase FkbM domain
MMHHVFRGAGLPIFCMSLDSFCAERGLHVNLIKIDVEGHELEVLKGAALCRATIDQRPVARSTTSTWREREQLRLRCADC